MQEMITEFRTVIPDLATHAHKMCKMFDRISEVNQDLKGISNTRSKELLVNDLNDTILATLVHTSCVLSCIDRLQKLNDSYQYKVGPKVTKPKNDHRQMELQFDGAMDNADNG
jgi:hypothetical protein